MLPVRAVRLSIGTLLAADPLFLGIAADGNKIALVKAPFTPSETMNLVSMYTLCSFTGSAPLVAPPGAQQVGLDPLSGVQIITIKEPLNGWRWIATDVANLPETVHGYILMDNAGVNVLASDLFPAPLPITAVGQEVKLGYAQIVVALQPLR